MDRPAHLSCSRCPSSRMVAPYVRTLSVPTERRTPRSSYRLLTIRIGNIICGRYLHQQPGLNNDVAGPIGSIPYFVPRLERLEGLNLPRPVGSLDTCPKEQDKPVECEPDAGISFTTGKKLLRIGRASDPEAERVAENQRRYERGGSSVTEGSDIRPECNTEGEVPVMDIAQRREEMRREPVPELPGGNC